MKTIDYYLNLDYEIIIRKITEEDGGGYFAYYKDFKGVMGDGETADAAIEDAKSAFKCYLEVALKLAIFALVVETVFFANFECFSGFQTPIFRTLKFSILVSTINANIALKF